MRRSTPFLFLGTSLVLLSLALGVWRFLSTQKPQEGLSLGPYTDGPADFSGYVIGLKGIRGSQTAVLANEESMGVKEFLILSDVEWECGPKETLLFGDLVRVSYGNTKGRDIARRVSCLSAAPVVISGRVVSTSSQQLVLDVFGTSVVVVASPQMRVGEKYMPTKDNVFIPGKTILQPAFDVIALGQYISVEADQKHTDQIVAKSVVVL